MPQQMLEQTLERKKSGLKHICKCNAVISPEQGENFSASIKENNTVENLDELMFILQDESPEKEKNVIHRSVLKSFELIKNNDVMRGFVL